MFTKNGLQMDSSDVTRAVPDLFEEKMNIRLLFSTYRHITQMITEQHCELDVGCFSIAYQAGHSPKLATRVYGRQEDQVYGTDRKNQVFHRGMSIAWQRFLGLLKETIQVNDHPKNSLLGYKELKELESLMQAGHARGYNNLSALMETFVEKMHALLTRHSKDLSGTPFLFISYTLTF